MTDSAGRRPNLLLVVMDTARADAFEPYGAAPGATPSTADLARRGAAHRAVAPANWTIPSHSAMLTGLLPRTLRLGQAPGGSALGCRPRLAAHSDRLLAAVLRRAGYSTRALSANFWISPLTGFDIGFDEFATIGGGRTAEIAGGGRDRARFVLEAVRARVDDGAAEAEALLTEWMAEPRDRPFFWFVNLVECHSPYLPPRPYNDLDLLARLRAGSEARRYLTVGAIWYACLGGFDIPEPALLRMRHLYARSIRLMDDWLGRVLERLDARGLLDETVVIVTSDHGENLGEGRLIGHSFSLDQRLIGLPLVMAGPARFPDRLLGLVELPRLLAEAIGLGDHPWVEQWGRDAVQVAQLDPLVAENDPRASQTASQWGLGDQAVRRMTTPMTCATDGRLKLVRDGDTELLFDLADDPLEQRPVPVSALTDAAINALRRAVDEATATPREVDETDDRGALPDSERAELERRMRLLGYL